MNFTCSEWNTTVYSELYSEISQFFTTTDYHTLIKIIYRILIKMWICIFSILPHLLTCILDGVEKFLNFDGRTMLASPETPIVVRILLAIGFVIGMIAMAILVYILAMMLFLTIRDFFYPKKRRAKLL